MTTLLVGCLFPTVLSQPPRLLWRFHTVRSVSIGCSSIWHYFPVRLAWTFRRALWSFRRASFRTRPSLHRRHSSKSVVFGRRFGQNSNLFCSYPYLCAPEQTQLFAHRMKLVTAKALENKWIQKIYFVVRKLARRDASVCGYVKDNQSHDL